MFQNFKEYDRFSFPENIVRVTSGRGGEALLIVGNDKTGLYDCGMAYCGEETVKNIEIELKKLNRSKLDYIFLSHTHYDHIGALPYIKKRWKYAVVCGSEKAKRVFNSNGAKKLIKTLGEAARNLYSDSKNEILITDLEVDIVVKDGDKISLGYGNDNVVVIETKGHTDCSLAFFVEKNKVMLASESTGVMYTVDYIDPQILKSYDDCINSALRCKNYNSDIIISPHYGVVPDFKTDEYFDLFIDCAENERNICKELLEKGKDKDYILKNYVNRFWNEDRKKEQPKEAFLINAGHIIDNIIDDIKNKAVK